MGVFKEIWGEALEKVTEELDKEGKTLDLSNEVIIRRADREAEKLFRERYAPSSRGLLQRQATKTEVMSEGSRPIIFEQIEEEVILNKWTIRRRSPEKTTESVEYFTENGERLLKESDAEDVGSKHWAEWARDLCKRDRGHLERTLEQRHNDLYRSETAIKWMVIAILALAAIGTLMIGRLTVLA